MSAHTPMDRAKLARRALDVACAKLKADAGRVPAEQLLMKWAKLRAAYEKRRETIRFASFVRRHRLEAVFGMEG